MAINVNYLSDTDGNIIYPMAHAMATYCKDGVTVQEKLDNLQGGIITETVWKEPVETYADLLTTYPYPEDGWTVNVNDTDYTYRWTGSEWIATSVNSIPIATDVLDGKMSANDHQKLHTHSNKAVLDGITQEKINKWDKAENSADKVLFDNTDTGMAAVTVQKAIEELNVRTKTDINTTYTLTKNKDKEIVLVGSDGSESKVSEYRSRTVVGSNAAVTSTDINEVLGNGEVFVNHIDANDRQSSIRLIGTGSTTVTKTKRKNAENGEGIVNYDTIVIETPTMPTDFKGSAHGLVPQSTSEDQNKFLKGDGTWADTAEAVFEGATTNNDGLNGLVPAPKIADRNKFLKGDGTWTEIVIPTYSDFTGITHGLVPASTASDTNKYLKSNGTWAEINQSIFGGATSAKSGSVGFVPQPKVGDQDKVLKGDGTWYELPLFSGATAIADGSVGLVPKPNLGEQKMFLCADGTWKNIDAGNVDDKLDNTSEHPVQNKVVTNKINALEEAIGDLPALLDAINRKVV